MTTLYQCGVEGEAEDNAQECQKEKSELQHKDCWLNMTDDTGPLSSIQKNLQNKREVTTMTKIWHEEKGTHAWQ